MEIFTGYFFIVVAVYMLIIGLVMQTENFRSFIILKFTPLAIGVVAGFLALHHYGFILKI